MGFCWRSKIPWQSRFRPMGGDPAVGIRLTEEARHLCVVLLRGRRCRRQRLTQQRVPALNGKYSRNAKPALLEFSDAAVDRVSEISPNASVDLDRDGNSSA